jgi:hypothetical protein
MPRTCAACSGVISWRASTLTQALRTKAPAIHQALTLLSAGLADADLAVAHFCRQSLHLCDPLIHPRYPAIRKRLGPVPAPDTSGDAAILQNEVDAARDEGHMAMSVTAPQRASSHPPQQQQQQQQQMPQTAAPPVTRRSPDEPHLPAAPRLFSSSVFGSQHSQPIPAPVLSAPELPPVQAPSTLNKRPRDDEEARLPTPGLAPLKEAAPVSAAVSAAPDAGGAAVAPDVGEAAVVPERKRANLDAPPELDGDEFDMPDVVDFGPDSPDEA